jgi:hypothetical protein
MNYDDGLVTFGEFLLLADLASDRPVRPAIVVYTDPLTPRYVRGGPPQPKPEPCGGSA